MSERIATVALLTMAITKSRERNILTTVRCSIYAESSRARSKLDLAPLFAAFAS